MANLLRYIASVKRFLLVLGAFCLIEIALAHILPAIIPQRWYFRMYLPWEAMKKTELFLSSQFNIIPSPDLGWRNKPNAVMNKIQYDHYGSRSHGGIVSDARKPMRIVFMGDSRIGGYNNLANDETVSAYLEHGDLETLNFATNLYGLDQVFLALPKCLSQFTPDVVVVAIGSDIGQALNCVYLPLTDRNVGAPLLKPRFFLQDGQLTCLRPEVCNLLQNIPNNPSLLEFIEKNDGHYFVFKHFQRKETLPFLSLFSLIQANIAYVKQQIDYHLGRPSWASVTNEKLAAKILNQMESEAEARNVRLVFLVMPKRSELKSGSHAYQQVVHMADSLGLRYIDGLAIFQRIRGSESLFFDEVHLLAKGNQVLASQLMEWLGPSTRFAVENQISVDKKFSGTRMAEEVERAGR
ncbi:MAG: hypothetical protein ACOY90_21595 [Candidatus Zhuqueibacterota bacterium]